LAKLEILESRPKVVRESIGKGLRAYDPVLLLFRKRVAIKVLDELKWREEGLETKAVDADRLEALVCALARDCRSKVSENISVLIGNISPKSRRQIYEVLLTVVENFPSRRPNLHSSAHPMKGAYYGGGWIDWHNAHWSSQEFRDDVMLGRKLKRAYYEWSQRNPNV
jgi:hypothetical protein